MRRYSMANAIWLVVALPLWYLVAFVALAAPLAAGPLPLIPAAGTLSLGVGVFLAKRQPQRGLLLFLVPFGLSEALVALAGLMRGQAREGQTDALLHFVNGSMFVFIAFQATLCAYLVFRLRAARSSAIALAIFSMTYAAFAVFVAAMSFSDSWL
jgi:hypothetical protein